MTPCNIPDVAGIIIHGMSRKIRDREGTVYRMVITVLEPPNGAISIRNRPTYMIITFGKLKAIWETVGSMRRNTEVNFVIITIRIRK
jgi:hypothetical protein